MYTDDQVSRRSGRTALAVSGFVGLIAASMFSCTPNMKSPTLPAPSVAFCTSMSGTLPGPTTEPADIQNYNNGSDGTYDADLQAFSDPETPVDGLGPVYNSNSCISCHQSPMAGQTSQVSVLRAGHFDKATHTFKEPVGGSLMFQRAINADVQVRVPEGFEIRTLRMTTSVMGDGLVECVDDNDILKVQAQQPESMQGSVLLVPVPIYPDDSRVQNGAATVERIGRFGWKCQEASLLEFSAGAYFNEMGITSKLHPKENTSNGRDVSAYDIVPETADHPFEDKISDPVKSPYGNDVHSFARFMRSTNPPPRAANLDPARVTQGEKVFTAANCATCHVAEWKTMAAGSKPADYEIPPALGGKTFYPYSDFMLHDIGTGDGIVQTQEAQRPSAACQRTAADPTKHYLAALASKYSTSKRLYRALPEMYHYVGPTTDTIVNDHHGQRYISSQYVNTAYMMRTAPLWGLRSRPQLMHDGQSLTLNEAICRHANQAKESRDAYLKLSDDDRCALLTFLMSL